MLAIGDVGARPLTKEKVAVCRCLGQLEGVVPSDLDIVLGPRL